MHPAWERAKHVEGIITTKDAEHHHATQDIGQQSPILLLGAEPALVASLFDCVPACSAWNSRCSGAFLHFGTSLKIPKPSASIKLWTRAP
jgi:hypothetical protein